MHSANLLHTSILDVTQTMIFPPPNVTVYCMNLRSIRAPVGFLQCLRRLWCNLTQNSSDKSPFCHFSSIHPLSRLWALAMPIALLIAFCLVLVSGHWFDHGCHFETKFNCSGWQRDVRWPGLGFSSQQMVLPSSCLGSAGPGPVKNFSSLFKSFF